MPPSGAWNDRPVIATPLSRRGLLLAAGATALVGCSGATIPRVTVSPTGSIRDQLRAVMERVSTGTDKLGVAVKDLRSGATYDFRGDYASQLASAAKPMIVAMALRKAGADALPQPQADQAARAIEHSDNDSADALFEWAGRRPAFDALAKDLGLAQTHSDPAKDFWSWCWTTPKDQLSFVEQLLTGSKALTAGQRAYLLHLMGKVEADQAWGVGKPRSTEVAVQLKNGWVQFQSTDNLWAVNSIGHVQGAGRDYLLTIMTRTADFDTGRELTSEIGTWVFNVLGSGTLT